MGKDGKTRVGKGAKGNGGGKGKGKMGGTGLRTGHGMGKEKGKEGKGGEGLQATAPPNFNSWRRHCAYRLLLLSLSS